MHPRKDTDIPLSESSVSPNLSLIQQRCSELMGETDGLELRLEEPAAEIKDGDPYNHQRLSTIAVIRRGKNAR